jgi:hypothetical protein
MADYKEQTLTGSQWQRCRTVTIQNPYGGQPMAYFQEEMLATVGADTIQRDVGSCSAPFNPASTIPLLDTTTLLPTGDTVTHGALYQILFSLYMQTALDRDVLAAA